MTNKYSISQEQNNTPSICMISQSDSDKVAVEEGEQQVIVYTKEWREKVKAS